MFRELLLVFALIWYKKSLSLPKFFFSCFFFPEFFSFLLAFFFHSRIIVMIEITVRVFFFSKNLIEFLSYWRENIVRYVPSEKKFLNGNYPHASSDHT